MNVARRKQASSSTQASKSGVGIENNARRGIFAGGIGHRDIRRVNDIIVDQAA